MYRRLIALALLVAASGAAYASAGAQDRSKAAPGCTFESLSQAEQKRYASRYKRRLRLDGKAHADNWLQEQACPSPAQEAAKRKRMTEKWGQNDKQGRPCKNYRMVNRATPSLGGGMTTSLVRVCAD
jgi:hypothetical protein